MGWACVLALLAAGQTEWNRPVEPFRIVGDLYYVGASDVSSYLFATREGHVLIDGGFVETAPLIEANLAKLGFRIEDVRLLLISHGHYDHVGGIARLRDRSGAKLLASPAEAPLLARGGKGDSQFGDKYPYPPAAPDRLLRDGEQIRLGGHTLTTHFTPGHTRGCTTWTATIEGKRVVIPCSLSAPGYKLTPDLVNEYESSFAKLRALPCDIFLGLHSWDFGLEEKRRTRSFVDPEGYRSWIDKSEQALRKQLAEQTTH